MRTVEPDIPYCKHCGIPVEKRDDGWWHRDGYKDCPPGFGDGLKATPVVTE